MKLYDFTQAPSPKRVRMFVAEKGIRIPSVQVDLGTQEQLKPGYQRLNPRGMVPMLELDDGTRIRETVAICRYLEALHPQPPLMGTDPKDAAIIEMWNREIEFDGVGGVADAFRNKVRGLAGRALPGVVEEVPQIPELAERGRNTALRCWRRLNEHMAGREFIASDRFTIVDITAYVMVWFAAWIKLTIPQEHKHLQAWYDRVAARPSASA